MPIEKLATAEVLETPTTLEEKVDRHGDLGAKIDKLEAQIENARVKALRERISELAGAQATLKEDILKEATVNLGNESKTEVHGARWKVEIGKCKMARAITNMKKLAELVGLDNYFELATFPLAKVDDYLNPKEREQVLDVSHDGARSFKVKAR